MNINETYKQLIEIYDSIKQLEKELNRKDEEITKLKEDKKMLLAQLTRLQNSGGSNGGTVEEPVDTVTVISNNKIVNSTNDDSNNIEYAEDYALNEGVVNYTHSDGNSFFTWDLTETLQSGTAYKLLLDISNTGGNARFRLFANNDGALTQLIGNTTYNNGTNTLNFTPEVNVSKLSLSTSSASTSFDFDNAILLLQSEEIEYEEVPVDSGSETPVEEGVFAFPSAYGAGADFTSFRSDFTVLHVTSLNDSDRNEVGTFRWAIQNETNKTLNRIVVFDVSGVIDLESQIYASNASGDEGGYTGSLYIAGQTAPQGGITITGDRIVIDGFDTIFRFSKFRHNGISQSGTLSVKAGSRHITDHCSFSHHSYAKSTTAIGIKQETNPANQTKGTFSNNLMGQNTIGFIAGESDPISSDVSADITVIRNAYYNISHRVPVKGGSAINIDVINNIVHNWDSRMIRMDGYAYDLVHYENLYQAGGNTTNELKWTSYLSNSGNPTIFTDNNYLEDDPIGNYEVPIGYDTDESVAWTEFQNNFVKLPSNYFTSTRRNVLGRAYNIYLNSQLKSEILSGVGACYYINDSGEAVFSRDTYDTEFVNGIINNSTSTRDTSLTLPIITESNTRPNDFYVSNPHIPEAYLTRRGITGNSTIHNQVQSSGYTLLEEYINQVDE